MIRRIRSSSSRSHSLLGGTSIVMRNGQMYCSRRRAASQKYVCASFLRAQSTLITAPTTTCSYSKMTTQKSLLRQEILWSRTALRAALIQFFAEKKNSTKVCFIIILLKLQKNRGINALNLYSRPTKKLLLKQRIYYVMILFIEAF